MTSRHDNDGQIEPLHNTSSANIDNRVKTVKLKQPYIAQMQLAGLLGPAAEHTKSKTETTAT